MMNTGETKIEEEPTFELPKSYRINPDTLKELAKALLISMPSLGPVVQEIPLVPKDSSQKFKFKDLKASTVLKERFEPQISTQSVEKSYKQSETSSIISKYTIPYDHPALQRLNLNYKTPSRIIYQLFAHVFQKQNFSFEFEAEKRNFVVKFVLEGEVLAQALGSSKQRAKNSVCEEVLRLLAPSVYAKMKEKVDMEQVKQEKEIQEENTGDTAFELQTRSFALGNPFSGDGFEQNGELKFEIEPAINKIKTESGLSDQDQNESSVIPNYYSLGLQLEYEQDGLIDQYRSDYLAEEQVEEQVAEDSQSRIGFLAADNGSQKTPKKIVECILNQASVTERSISTEQPKTESPSEESGKRFELNQNEFQDSHGINHGAIVENSGKNTPVEEVMQNITYLVERGLNNVQMLQESI